MNGECHLKKCMHASLLEHERIEWLCFTTRSFFSRGRHTADRKGMKTEKTNGKKLYIEQRKELHHQSGWLCVKVWRMVPMETFTWPWIAYQNLKSQCESLSLHFYFYFSSPRFYSSSSSVSLLSGRQSSSSFIHSSCVRCDR